MMGRQGLWWQFFLLGLGLILVGIAAMLWVVRPSESQVQTEKVRSAPLPAPPTKVVGINPEQMHKEKMEASIRVASVLAHEMRGPLASILGYSQIILAKNPEPEIIESTESILREARSARSVLDKLLGYTGESAQEKSSLRVEGPLVKALKDLEPVFTQKGVKIIRQVQENSPLNLNGDAIVRALKNILQNSVEAMERMSKKEITIDLFESAEEVHLNIRDTGEGIEPQNIEKIFDPFFTTRSYLNHMGLGLSAAFGILKEHNAQLKIVSQSGQGSLVEIIFKKVQAVEAKPLVVAAELPQLKEESVYREEAENHFKEIEQEQQKVASPLEINIDAMLELPEEVVVSEKPPVQEESESEADLSEASVTHVADPTDEGIVKASKLDSYQVAIRRPGKRS